MAITLTVEEIVEAFNYPKYEDCNATSLTVVNDDTGAHEEIYFFVYHKNRIKDLVDKLFEFAQNRDLKFSLMDAIRLSAKAVHEYEP